MTTRFHIHALAAALTLALPSVTAQIVSPASNHPPFVGDLAAATVRDMAGSAATTEKAIESRLARARERLRPLILECLRP